MTHKTHNTPVTPRTSGSADLSGSGVKTCDSVANINDWDANISETYFLDFATLTCSVAFGISSRRRAAKNDLLFMRLVYVGPDSSHAITAACFESTAPRP